jgi:hypothetical protein
VTEYGMENEEETSKQTRIIECQNQIKNQSCGCKVINYAMIINKRKEKWEGEKEQTLERRCRENK